MTLYLVAAVAVPLLWLAAWLAWRRVPVARLWVMFDLALAAGVGVYLAFDGRAEEGALLALALAPALILFSVVRTLQMRYIERKTRALLDGNPAMRDAYDRRSAPTRAERRARDDPAER